SGYDPRMRVPGILSLLAMILTSACGKSAPSPGPGVPLTLAEERAARVSNLRYKLFVSVPESHTEGVSGRVTVRFDLRDASKPLAFDFAGEFAALDASSGARAELTEEHLIVPASALREGANELTIEFRSADAPLNRNPEFLYAL